MVTLIVNKNKNMNIKEKIGKWIQSDSGEYFMPLEIIKETDAEIEFKADKWETAEFTPAHAYSYSYIIAKTMELKNQLLSRGGKL